MDSTNADQELTRIEAPILPTARRGILFVLSYQLLQIVFGVLIGAVLGFVIAVKEGPSANQTVPEFLKQFETVLGLAAFACTVVVVFGWLYHRIRDPNDGFSMQFLRLVPVSMREAGAAFSIGVSIAVLYIAFVVSVGPKEAPQTLGPLVTLAVSMDWTFYLWVLFGLAAPFIEEVVFRGVLLRCCLTTWPTPPGSVVASVLTAGAFFAMHWSEMIHVPLAATGIAALAMATTWFGMKRTVTEAIALHFGYNLIIVTLMVMNHFQLGPTG